MKTFSVLQWAKIFHLDQMFTPKTFSLGEIPRILILSNVAQKLLTEITTGKWILMRCKNNLVSNNLHLKIKQRWNIWPHFTLRVQYDSYCMSILELNVKRAPDMTPSFDLETLEYVKMKKCPRVSFQFDS